MGTITTTARLAMQMEVGLTPKGKVAHRTTSFSVRPDLSTEDAREVVAAFQLLVEFPITSARLIVKDVNRIWDPEMRKEKLEEEETNSAQMQRMQQRHATQMGVSVSGSSGSGVTASASVPVSGSAPVQQNAPVQTAPSVLAEEAAPMKAMPAAPDKPRGFEAVPYEYEEAGNGDSEPLALEGGVSLAERAAALFTQEKIAQSQNFMTRMRANGYQVHIDELTRNPFMHTVAQKGTEQRIETLEPPIYGDGNQVQ